MNIKQREWALVLALFLTGKAADASLIDRGNGMIYDTDLNITWLWDANYAKTSGYDSDGKMTWKAAVAWAAQLTYGGYSDWRLPTALNQDARSKPCFGKCIGSEMGHLFYSEFGATGSILTGNPTELAKFTNIQPTVYWLGTEYAQSRVLEAWDFDTGKGNQSFDFKKKFHAAWAVRSGDVAAPVPEPESLLLLGSGMVALLSRVWARRLG
jgi:hypothetical protein